mgnify:FL=1
MVSSLFPLLTVFDTEKNMRINKHNQILLNKLVEISSGKQTSVVPAPKRVREIARQNPSVIRNLSISNLVAPLASTRARGSSVGPHSLNFSVRKRENERIERENHKFAKRLFENNGIISKKHLEEDYMQQEKYRVQIAKVRASKPKYSTLE